jgi:hypothetical protein
VTPETTLLAGGQTECRERRFEMDGIIGGRRIRSRLRRIRVRGGTRIRVAGARRLGVRGGLRVGDPIGGSAPEPASNRLAEDQSGLEDKFAVHIGQIAVEIDSNAQRMSSPS